MEAAICKYDQDMTAVLLDKGLCSVIFINKLRQGS